MINELAVKNKSNYITLESMAGDGHFLMMDFKSGLLQVKMVPAVYSLHGG